MPRLRCKTAALKTLARRYEYQASKINLFDLKAGIDARGFLTKADLRAVARWKATRSAGRMEKNSEAYVQEISGFALTTADERARIEALTLLDGVRWPTASVVLHFFHRNRYPIVDFRALWTVSMDVPSQYSFDFWSRYVEYCRTLATRARINMRVLDQALWQYSKEKQ